MPDPFRAIAVLLLIAVVLWLAFLAVLWLHRPSRELAGAALRLPPDVLSLSRALVADPATPRSAKVALGALAIYLMSPIDLVPDFIPVVGSLDDVIVAGLVLRWVGRRIGRAELEAHWTGTQAGLSWLLRLL
jgi:uncharacterized membrane protein YkvA (DUF1232 family)